MNKQHENDYLGALIGVAIYIAGLCLAAFLLP